MIELGGYIRDIFKLNKENHNFRIFGPDESMSNRLYKVFEEENRDWNAQLLDTDDCLARNGRIMDGMLSEHMCEGWLEGYLLTGRHGFFASYEAFIRIVDSMAAQHAKLAESLQPAFLETAYRFSELYPDLQCMAAGPQWIYSSGSRLPGSHCQQESRCCPHVSPAGY